jgi:hypothetical protein
MDPINEPSSIEFLFIADHAEAQNGKLSVIGGCWTDHTRTLDTNGAPSVSHFGIAASVYIPWNQRRNPPSATITVENEDATEQLFQVEIQTAAVDETQGLPEGSDQHAVFAINANFTFPATGGWRVIGDLKNGSPVRRWFFRVH